MTSGRGKYDREEKHMKRRVFSAAAALAFCLSLLPPAAWAADANWTDGLTAAPEGYAEEGDTVTVTTPEGLAWVAVQVNGLNGQTAQDFYGKTVVLDGDIDLQGKNWTPIGRSAR